MKTAASEQAKSRYYSQSNCDNVSGAIDTAHHQRRALCGLHPEKQDEDDTENEERQRTSENQAVLPIELHHETAAPSKLGSAR